MSNFQKFLAKLALKAFSKACDKLISKGKSIDLNKNDTNDLQEWRDWAEKALEELKK